VDDDPDIGLLVKTMLEYYGYTVAVTEKGEKVEEMIETSAIDLLVMDMLLSGINGVDVCSRIRNNDKISSIPILMVSAHHNAREVCLEAGADDFIAKPFEIQEMKAKIDQLVGEKRKIENQKA
jgi:DNA-binding response OmpR family regulator